VGPEPGLASITRAAQRLDTSRRSIYRLHERGELEIVYLGPRSPRVREADLDRLVRDGVSHRQAA
jgi:excisionase family DNA binding protein